MLDVARTSAELLAIKFYIHSVHMVFLCGLVLDSVQYGSWALREQGANESF